MQGNHKIVINSRPLGPQLDTPRRRNVINDFHANIGADDDTRVDASVTVLFSHSYRGLKDSQRQLQGTT